MKGMLIEDNGDLMVRNGCLVVGDCLPDVVERLIGAFQGEFKEQPLLGGNARDLIGGNPDPFWAGEVRGQLKKVGVPVSAINVTGGEISLSIND
jgi:hypothetical protein